MTTPTNEAGHGLPGVAAAREVIRAYFAGELDDTMILNLSESLALSRGVPEGTWLWGKLMDWCRSQGTSPANFDSLFAIASEAHKLYSAPAAAGAQGEEYAACCDTPAYCSSVRRCTRMDSTPHPAAADGGVREASAAVSFDLHNLPAEWPWDEGSPCLDPRPVGMVYPAVPTPRAFGYLDKTGVEWAAYDTGQMEEYGRRAFADGANTALRAISAALSSHRQAGDDLSKFRELAERWRVMSDPYHGKCADEILALVEKGAGNG